MADQFEFTSGRKKAIYLLIGLGLIALIIGIIMAAGGHGHWSAKVWSNILVNNMFFLGIALASLFFIAAHYVALGGWHVLVKRVMESMSMFIPVAGILMLVIIIGLITHKHHIYHWADADAVAHDPILQGKSAYLNIPFFTIRFVIYFGLWSLFAFLLRKQSLAEDRLGGLSPYKKSKVFSAIFLIIFAISSSTMSWDFMMSINAHWYSTLFGWYTFSSIFVSALAAMIILTIYLKSKGYLPQVNREHLHDLGKYMFAFSIFWTYLWFSQYMLIWYSNLGEETMYYRERIDNYKFLFYANLVINFLVPFLALMKRNSKRKLGTLAAMSLILLFGHWLDFYLMITPGATGNEVSLGVYDIAMLVGYAGLFLLVFFSSLSKAPLTAVNHPFYKESVHHHT